jgi:hypothetical protein
MRVLAALIAGLSLLTGPQAFAQLRSLPADTERGVIRHVRERDVEIDYKPMRLAPGATIRDTRNLIIVPASLPGDGALAEYTLDSQGMVFRVWLLTEQEATRVRERKR